MLPLDLVATRAVREPTEAELQLVSQLNGQGAGIDREVWFRRLSEEGDGAGPRPLQQRSAGLGAGGRLALRGAGGRRAEDFLDGGLDARPQRRQQRAQPRATQRQPVDDCLSVPAELHARMLALASEVRGQATHVLAFSPRKVSIELGKASIPQHDGKPEQFTEYDARFCFFVLRPGG
ncbi:unnamed protein product [Prorocentrum cordatum]|nr:unnamed protein product [Polarella glacialis]